MVYNAAPINCTWGELIKKNRRANRKFTYPMFGVRGMTSAVTLYWTLVLLFEWLPSALCDTVLGLLGAKKRVFKSVVHELVIKHELSEVFYQNQLSGILNQSQWSRIFSQSQLAGIFIQNQFSGAFIRISYQEFLIRASCQEFPVRIIYQESSVRLSCQELSIKVQSESVGINFQSESMISRHSMRQHLSVFHQNSVILTISQISQLVAEVVSNQNQVESILTALTSTLVRQNQLSPVNPEAIKLLKYAK
ncbi:hypothetical protein K0M31_017138 [Melipona bicolor]|uniref:Uncharacterized protein n=1 Tax=Melipona bicolor TaxID=60889 RepID=A0AA40KEA8_9HYME|nr:hypothetical protein K0M31_017138 [Melipona bicolor]